MNIYQTINDELNYMNINNFDKLVYCYWKLARLFSFDERWYYASYLQDYILKNHIQYRKIDLSNVDDFLVVCHSYSREVVKQIIPIITGFQVSLIESIHSYNVITDNKGNEFMFDATPDDLARIKCGLEPQGFEAVSKKNNHMIKESYKKLGLIFKKDNLYLELLNEPSLKVGMDKLNLSLQKSICNKYFTDANYFLKSYIQGYIADTDIFVDEKNSTEDNIKFHKLIYFPNENLFYDLHKPFDKYIIRQINAEEYETKVRTLTKIQG